MSVLSKYQQASFRGVEFLIRSESQTRGKKVVIHEYPNSDRRFVEELGKLPASFTIKAFVHSQTAVEDAIKLQKALDTSGVGVLIHPIYGRLEVKSTTYEQSTTETEMGEIVFDIKFEQSESNISLTPSITSTASVTSFADAARSAGYTALKAAMIIMKAKETLLTTQRVSSAAMGLLHSNFKSLTGLDASALSAFDRAFGTFTRNIYQAVLAVEDFASALQSVYDAARDTTDPASQKTAWKSLLGYESTRTPGPTNTAIRQANEANTEAINSHTRANALVNMYESIAYGEYKTDSEIQEARDLLDSTFETLFGNSDDPITSDRDFREAVLDLRNATNDILNESSKNVYKIQEINTNDGSLPLIAYQYYGNLDMLDTLLDLNPTVNWAEVQAKDLIKVAE